MGRMSNHFSKLFIRTVCVHQAKLSPILPALLTGLDLAHVLQHTAVPFRNDGQCPMQYYLAAGYDESGTILYFSNGT